jgi:hypothetical protein
MKRYNIRKLAENMNDLPALLITGTSLLEG